MTIQKQAWLEFCAELTDANGFAARELLFRGPGFDGETNFGEFGDWPLMLPGAGAKREFVVRERKDG